MTDFRSYLRNCKNLKIIMLKLGSKPRPVRYWDIALHTELEAVNLQ